MRASRVLPNAGLPPLDDRGRFFVMIKAEILEALPKLSPEERWEIRAKLNGNSAVCARAGEVLLAQHRPKLGLAAVDKALLADPTDLSTQRLRLKILDAMSR